MCGCSGASLDHILAAEASPTVHSPGAAGFSSRDDEPTGRPVVVGSVNDLDAPRQTREPTGRLLRLARYLRELGLEPLVVTRIGDDVQGRQVLGIFRNWGLDASGVQVDPRLPTGGPRDGPRPGGAFEALDPKSATEAISATSAALIYQAASKVRSEGNAAALRHIQGATGLPFFVDIDVEETWPESSGPRSVMLGAKWLRIGAIQLSPLLRPSGVRRRTTIAEAARAIQRRFALDVVVVDHRRLPLLAVSDRQIAEGPEGRCDVDALDVRARDAATAALIAGVTVGLSLSTLMTRAAEFALAFGLSRPPAGLGGPLRTRPL